MEFKPATLQQCAEDFADNVWPTLFPKERGQQNREWAKVRMFVIAVREGTATEGRILKYLREHGGDRYEIGITCGIKTETEK